MIVIIIYMLDVNSLEDLRKDATFDHVSAARVIELLDAYQALKNDYKELETDYANLQGRMFDMYGCD